MKEQGEFPGKETGAVEFYEWSKSRRTLYYIPVDGEIERYAFSRFPRPEFKNE